MFSKVGNRNAKVFLPNPDHHKLRISGFALPLPLESPEFAGPTGRQLGWLVFWSTFLNKGIGDLKGQRTNLEKFVQLHVSKLQPHPSEKGSQGLQPKDSSVDSVFLSKMHHGCSRRLSVSCVIQHMWAKKLSHDVSCIGITNIK